MSSKYIKVKNKTGQSIQNLAPFLLYIKILDDEIFIDGIINNNKVYVIRENSIQFHMVIKENDIWFKIKEGYTIDNVLELFLFNNNEFKKDVLNYMEDYDDRINFV